MTKGQHNKIICTDGFLKLRPTVLASWPSGLGDLCNLLALIFITGDDQNGKSYICLKKIQEVGLTYPHPANIKNSIHVRHPYIPPAFVCRNQFFVTGSSKETINPHADM